MRLTGDPQADADIMAFMKARQNILQQSTNIVSCFVKYPFYLLDNGVFLCIQYVNEDE